MKSLFPILCCAAGLRCGTARGGVVLCTNRDGATDRTVLVPPHPIVARPLAEGYGFLAVGHFGGMADTAIATAATTVPGIASLAASFVQFGASTTMGVDRQHGLFDFAASGTIAPGGPYDGQPIYLVIGDASTFARSPSLLIYRTGATFTPDDTGTGPGGGFTGTPISVLLSPAGGSLVTGFFAAGQYTLAASAKPTEVDYLNSFLAECPTANLTDVNADPDGDGLTNREEYQRCTNPCQADTDLDGRTDRAEVVSLALAPAERTDALHPDTDGDGVPDGIEIFYGYQPNSAASTLPFRTRLQHVFPLDGHPFDLKACARLEPSLLSPALGYETGHWHRCAMVTGPDPTTAQSLSTTPAMAAGAGGFGLQMRVRVEEFTQPDQILASQGTVWSLRRSGSTDRLRFIFGSTMIESSVAVEVAPSGTLSSPEAQPMHRIAVSAFFGQYMEFYIDGQRQGRVALNAPSAAITAADLASSLRISSTVAMLAARMRVDDVAWWDRPLAPLDISLSHAEYGPAWDLPARPAPWQPECLFLTTAGADKTLTLVWPTLYDEARYKLSKSTDMSLGSWSTVQPSLDVPFHTVTNPDARLFFKAEEVP